MKQCPCCQSIIDAETECPICGETLTYVDPHPAHREKIAANRYAVRYYAGRCWLVCLLSAAVVFLLLTARRLDPAMTVGALVCCAGGLLLAIFARQIERRWGRLLHSRDYHTEEYRKLSVGMEQYLLLAIALILALIQRIQP